MAKPKVQSRRSKDYSRSARSLVTLKYLALLDWRNTPSQVIHTSPTQSLMGSQCKTLLPIAETLLMPRHNTEEETRALVGAKERQRIYYNRNAKPLPIITPGETIRMRLPGEKRWTKGMCAQELDNRSYQVKVGSCKYRRSHRDLYNTGEKSLVDSPEVDAPIYGDDNSLHLRPPVLILHQQLPTLLGREISTLMGLESPVVAARLHFGKGTLSWDYIMLLF